VVQGARPAVAHEPEPAARLDLGVGPYVPDLLRAWRPTHGDDRHMQVDGTLAFVDISGFTRLTERLARKGNVGAEEMSDLLNATFSALLADRSGPPGRRVHGTRRRSGHPWLQQRGRARSPAR